jgi:AcrR family transcriptional regulator
MTDAEVRGPGRPRAGSEDKRERILREAAAVFSRLGYTGASLAEVAREADISKAGLLHHFGSKEALFAAVLERRDVDDHLVHGEPEDVWALFEMWIAQSDRNADRPGMVGLYTAMTSGALDPGHPAHPWLHAHLEEEIDRLTAAFERGKKEGAVSLDAPSRRLARTIIALSDGIQVQWLCARADAEASGRTAGPTPDHGGEPLDMAAQLRLLLEMIRSQWAVGGPDPGGRAHRPQLT